MRAGRETNCLPCKERLADLMTAVDTDHSQFSGTYSYPIELLAKCERIGLEGIVSKRRDSAYRSGPTRDWIKTNSAEWKKRIEIGSSCFTSGDLVARTSTFTVRSATIGACC